MAYAMFNKNIKHQMESEHQMKIQTMSPIDFQVSVESPPDQPIFFNLSGKLFMTLRFS